MNANKLHKLIHSMSNAEKRHFQQSIRGGRNTKSVQLFLAVLKQKEYEEVSLMKKLGYTENPNGFSVAKNHLYKLVLKGVRETSSTSNDYQKALEYLKNIDILEGRGLRDSALQFLQKLQEIAEKNQWNAFLLVAEKWKYKLSEINEIPDLSILNIGNYIDTEIRYEHFYRRLVQDNLIYGFSQRLNEEHSYKEILSAPLMQSIENVPNLLCKWYFCLIKVELAKSEKNKEQLQIWAEKLIAIKYEMGILGCVENDWCATSHFEYLNALIVNRDLSKFHEEYPKIFEYEIPTHRLDLLNRRKRDALLLRLHAFVFEKYSPEIFDELIKRAELYFETKNCKRIDIKDVSLVTTVIYLYYSSGEYNKVLEWSAYYSEHIDRNLYIDSYVINQVFTILSHQKLNNIEHMVNLIPSLERHMDRHNRLIPVHIFLLRYLKKMQYPVSRKEKNALLRDFKADMKILAKSGSKGHYLQPESLFIWAESQIANMTLFEMNQLVFEEGVKEWN